MNYAACGGFIVLFVSWPAKGEIFQKLQSIDLSDVSRVIARTARRRAASTMAIPYITIIMTRSACAPTRATAELCRVQGNPTPFIVAILMDIDKPICWLLAM